MVEDKEKRIANISLVYYSRQDIQKAIFDFCKNRETIARNFDIFSKRPDALEYPSEVFSQVKLGFSSFHCSEELWSNPTELSTELNQEQINKLRIGWDLLIDIDCKWIDYSKIAALAIIKTLEQHGIKNYGLKFSGGKGFHIIVPWKAFPKEINGKETKNLFPEIPRQVVAYIRSYAEKLLPEFLPKDVYSQFEKTSVKKGIKCLSCSEISQEYQLLTLFCIKCKRQEIKKIFELKEYNCPDCRIPFQIKNSQVVYECKRCNKNSASSPENFSKSKELDFFELMGLDIVLVSPRHLFRAPYSLHEKGLSSIVLSKKELENFEPKQADPLRVQIKNFYPQAEEGEARELLINALDWNEKKKQKTEKREFKEVKIDRKNISHPPCILKILQGLEDGKKRAAFILINYFRSLGYSLEEVETELEKWNKKNKPPLKPGYLKSQINWYEKQGKKLPPNCDKDYYKGIGICNPDNLCSKIKNPLNYVVRKNYHGKRK